MPGVTFEAATNTTTPVEVFNVYVPSFAIVTTPSASHVAGDDPGVMRHVAAVSNPAADVANPEAPVKVVNDTVPSGMTDFVCAVATGGAGSATVTVIVAFVNCWIPS